MESHEASLSRLQSRQYAIKGEIAALEIPPLKAEMEANNEKIAHLEERKRYYETDLRIREAQNMHMTARLSDWMKRNKIFRLADLERAVAAYQTDFDLISEHRRAVKKIETGLKYIDTVVRLKPIADKAKSGFKLLRERYAEEHADEIAEYNKAVRYLKANQMIESGNLIQDDLAKYEARRETLLKEIARTEEKLRAADLDPEIIRTIRYQVEKVMEARDIPEKKESVIGKLERYKTEAEAQKRQEERNKKPIIECYIARTASLGSSSL